MPIWGSMRRDQKRSTRITILGAWTNSSRDRWALAGGSRGGSSLLRTRKVLCRGAKEISYGDGPGSRTMFNAKSPTLNPPTIEEGKQRPAALSTGIRYRLGRHQSWGDQKSSPGDVQLQCAGTRHDEPTDHRGGEATTGSTIDWSSVPLGSAPKLERPEEE